MSIVDSIFMQMFGRPKDVLGRFGGIIMARMNQAFTYSVIDLLEIQSNDKVLEVGFGSGVGIQRLTKLASAGYIAGIDYSQEMVEQATARNIAEIEAGLVDLRQGSVESLPFEDNTFNKALAVNSMQVWPDAVVGLREVRRVMKVGGRIALGFTFYSGQPSTGLTQILTTAGFTQARLVQTDRDFCALAIAP
ncbi:class I SAM-dependent methyltransferase [Nostoc favosum]|uniref:Class I SAM-dependent methyltransferase n=1 Tax=Nostoc favosum CHAB5714 TaxID=2780399 RepID=A0ABS8I802_9NOSO|nr:class I SAM-dependent methyltransferase [Nostoc favosum]MCC5599834.1 class I SAM-dependent methyltransferase [Nostoc favosum CHAB5714]